MILSSFFFQNNLERVSFFEETILVANINIEVVLKILFLSFNNIDNEFIELKKLIWRSYSITKVLSTINQIKLINKRKFAIVVLDKNSKNIYYICISSKDQKKADNLFYLNKSDNYFIVG